MEKHLTDEQRKWLGTAIAVAAADGVLEKREQELIVQICADLQLSAEARAEVEAMLRNPPNPVELASWAISARDRVGLYRTAVEMAAADEHLDPSESLLLKTLASVLALSAEEIEAAKGAAKDGE